MKIIPLGAAGGEVTGSAYLVETNSARILVDCGLFQGGHDAEGKNRAPLLKSTGGSLDAVLVTHGHLDHTGRLPLLAQAGYDKPVFATPATVEMAALILRDSAKIQAQDAERRNRKLQEAGDPQVTPLYTPDDAERIIRLFAGVGYGSPAQVAPGIKAIWKEAGHMLGSASIQVLVQEDGKEKRIVFSGDLGPKGAPILRDYEPFREADLVFLESTYGDHDHRPFVDTVKEFIEIVQQAVREGGKIIVPTFAVGRAQLLTILMSWIFRNGKVPPFPVYLDSPMAVEASKIYAHHPELFDDELNQYLKEGSLQNDLRTLRMTVTADQSKTINTQEGPALIMAGAGMCTAGRILYHLKNHLGKPGSHVIIVGYQANGSLGRMLVNGEKSVKIHGEKIAVKATVHTLGGFSAHAGQTDLMHWFEAIARCKPRVALTHGENGPRKALAELVQQKHGIKAILPEIGEGIVV